MTDTALIQRISIVLDKLMANEEQFTLLDVSNAVKADGGIFVRHTEVRDVSKPILDIIIKNNSVYEVHQIEVTTSHGPDVADLYTPYFKDVDEYTNTSQSAIKPPSPTVVTNPAPAQVPVDNVPVVASRADAYKLVSPRSDGSINIPKSLIEIADIANDYVDIINHPNSISIVVGNDRPMPNELRISKTALLDSNLSDRKVYVCAFAFKGKIVIAEK